MHNAFLMSTTYLLTHAPSLHWRRRDPEIVIFFDSNFFFSDGLRQVGSHGEWFQTNFFSVSPDRYQVKLFVDAKLFSSSFLFKCRQSGAETNVIKVLGRVEKKLVFCGSKMLELFFHFVQETIFIYFWILFPIMCLWWAWFLKI